MASENETIADIEQALRDGSIYDENGCFDSHEIADRLKAAAKREREEIVDAVSVLRDGMCLHCDLQQQCADGEDGMSTTCNAMAIVNNFINRYKKLEVSDECPF